jgi:hypothetical protein
MPNSNHKVWWKCKKGHEWEASVSSRNRGNGCPYCSGKLVIIGETDLKSINPNLALEWNYEKNNGITPMDVMPGSGNRAYGGSALSVDMNGKLSFAIETEAAVALNVQKKSVKRKNKVNAPCCASLNARGAIFLGSLTSKLADSLCVDYLAQVTTPWSV